MSCLSVCLSIVNLNLPIETSYFVAYSSKDSFQRTPRSITLTFVLEIAFWDFVATGGIVFHKTSCFHSFYLDGDPKTKLGLQVYLLHY